MARLNTLSLSAGLSADTPSVALPTSISLRSHPLGHPSPRVVPVLPLTDGSKLAPPGDRLHLVAQAEAWRAGSRSY